LRIAIWVIINPPKVIWDKIKKVFAKFSLCLFVNLISKILSGIKTSVKQIGRVSKNLNPQLSPFDKEVTLFIKKGLGEIFGGLRGIYG